MKILHISDTHGFHDQFKDMPAADVLVHSGDFTFAGSWYEASEFLTWFCALPYKQKLLIAGNHDACLYGACGIQGLPDNVHYLCNSGVLIDGIRFYGVPMFMEDCMNGTYEQLINNIPDDTDVLVTHQPPCGICDEADYGKGLVHHGNETLARRVRELQLKCCLFGHEHDAGGTVENINGTVFSNAALLDSAYKLNAKPYLLTI